MKDPKGLNYRGTQSVTKDNRPCQRWDSDTPNENKMSDKFTGDLDIYESQNFCRNPDNDPKGPWCYYDDH